MISDSGQPGTGAQRPGDEATYELCYRVAYQVAIAILGSPADAEDVAQDTCLVVFTESQAGKPIDDLRKYASTTAYHKALKAKKRNARWVGLVDEHASADDKSAVLGARSTAAKAIASLTTAQRLVLCLHFGQGMSAAEVSSLFGTSPGAVLELAKSARRKAQERYAELAGVRRDMPLECAHRARQIWAMVTG